MNRRKFLTALGLGTVGMSYTFAVEPRWLEVGRHEIKLSKGERSSLKILQLSDLHASPFVSLDFIREAVKLGLSLSPDVICLTGDFVTRGYDRLNGYAEVLKPLADAAPTYACLGNHDGGRWAARREGYTSTNAVRNMLSASGAKLLHNTSESVRVRDWDLTLVGLGDIWAHEMQPSLAFRSVQQISGGATVVLAHNPDSKDALKNYTWNLMLSGHTHGGQVKLPFFGAPISSVRDRRFQEGLHEWEGRWIHVTRGVGSLYSLRFNCPPEVSLITLV